METSTFYYHHFPSLLFCMTSHVTLQNQLPCLGRSSRHASATCSDCPSTALWLFFPLSLCPSAPTFPYKTAASPKHFIKTLSRWKSTPLPSAQPPPLSHNPDFISRRKQLFDIPHHKWNIFCVLDPARSSLPPGLIREFSCFIFMQSTLMKQPLIIRWLPLLYTEVSCSRLIYALLILMRHRTMSLCIPISTGEILIPTYTYNCSSWGINCLQHRRLVFTEVLLCPETMETRQRTYNAQIRTSGQRYLLLSFSSMRKLLVCSEGLQKDQFCV